MLLDEWNSDDIRDIELYIFKNIEKHYSYEGWYTIVTDFAEPSSLRYNFARLLFRNIFIVSEIIALCIGIYLSYGNYETFILNPLFIICNFFIFLSFLTILYQQENLEKAHKKRNS
jgi:hypothetical protein